MPHVLSVTHSRSATQCRLRPDGSRRSFAGSPGHVLKSDCNLINLVCAAPTKSSLIQPPCGNVMATRSQHRTWGRPLRPGSDSPRLHRERRRLAAASLSGLNTSIEALAECITASATLPRDIRARPPRPCVAIATDRTFSRLTKIPIALADVLTDDDVGRHGHSTLAEPARDTRR